MNESKFDRRRILAASAALLAGCASAPPPAPSPLSVISFGGGFNVLATARGTIGPYLGICGAARRRWARQHRASLVAFIHAYRDAVRWLEQTTNRAAAEKILLAHVPAMSPRVAQQSCELLLDPVSGFYADSGLDERAVRAVLELRGRLGQPPRRLDNPLKYIDREYWQQAMAGSYGLRQWRDEPCPDEERCVPARVPA